MKRIILVLLILVVILAGCKIELPETEQEENLCETCEECPEEKAMVTSLFDSWGENIDNSDEYIFTMGIINYGYAEAKNIEVTCTIERKGKIEFEKSKNIGNIASTSLAYEELVFDIGREYGQDSLGMCFITDCKDCEILDNRIDELRELRGD